VQLHDHRDEFDGRLWLVGMGTPAQARAFKDETAALNARVQSAPVAAQLQSADELEARVASAFEGPGQPARQNALSKAAGAAAVDARRAGSKQ